MYLVKMIVGVVGKANVGKSTFFKAATLADVEIANYPFVTIKANEGIGFVKTDCVDKDFNIKCNPREGYCINNYRFVPVKIVDVAGLVPGAHMGKGMGNQFLDDLRQADILVHIVDIAGSTNEKGEPTQPGSYDPANDIRFLEDEINLWMLGLIKKGWERLARTVHQTKAKPAKALASHLSAFNVSENLLEKVIDKLQLNEDILKWDDRILLRIVIEIRKMTKPMIIACNKIDVPGAISNFERLRKEFPGHTLVACSSESELALKEAAKHDLIDYTPGADHFDIKDESRLNDAQKYALKFIENNILKKFESTGVQQVLDDAVFKLLKYIAVFPVANPKLEDSTGKKLPDCFLVSNKTTALEFAFKVHTDIGKNFVRAIDLKTKKIVGKEHLLKNRDVIEIITSK